MALRENGDDVPYMYIKSTVLTMYCTQIVTTKPFKQSSAKDNKSKGKKIGEMGGKHTACRVRVVHWTQALV